MTDKNRNLDEHGNNLLNPNVSTKREDCPRCRGVIRALETIRDAPADFEMALLDILHCDNGHRIPDEEIRRVLYHE